MPLKMGSFRYRNNNGRELMRAFSGTCRFRARLLVAVRRNGEGHVVAMELDLGVALMLEPARRPRRDDPVPPRPKARCGTGGFSVIRGSGGSSTLMPGDALVKRPHGVLRAGRPKRASRASRPRAPSGTRARTFAREQAAEAPADDHDRPFVAEASTSASQVVQRVGSARPRFQPMPQP